MTATIEENIFAIMSILGKYKLNLNNEKLLQSQIVDIFSLNNILHLREHRLDDKNILDFFINGIAIEIKIGGQAKKIYRQCERYAQFDEVKAILLVANKATGFPKSIIGKDCYVLNIGKAWM